MRFLCLDIGEKRIGVAISDSSGLTASILTTINRKGIKNDIKDIKAIIDNYRIGKIVVGMPYNLSGGEGVRAGQVKKFIKELKKGIEGVEIVEWDERFSTMAVERVLIESDISRSKRKKVIDGLSAVYILQGFLDSQVK